MAGDCCVFICDALTTFQGYVTDRIDTKSKGTVTEQNVIQFRFIEVNYSPLLRFENKRKF